VRIVGLEREHIFPFPVERKEPLLSGSRDLKVGTELKMAVESISVVWELDCSSDKAAMSSSSRYAKFEVWLEKTKLHVSSERKLESDKHSDPELGSMRLLRLFSGLSTRRSGGNRR
jgi:hypothetical protein